MPRPSRVAHRPLAAAAAAALLALASPAALAAQTFSGPTPYLSFADSPFNGLSFSWFHLEDFEDGLLNTPGASLLEPGTSIPGPGPLTDSVDGDDGSIDGSGAGGHSLFSNFATTTLTFDFDAGVLGALPTHAGIVWTDDANVTSGTFGTGIVSFEAFDASLASLGAIGPFTLGDGVFDATTTEDRFLGVAYAGGIRRIRLTTANSVDWEADHLQYGRIASVTPEPASLALAATGLAALGGLAAVRRRRPAAG